MSFLPSPFLSNLVSQSAVTSMHMKRSCEPSRFHVELHSHRSPTDFVVKRGTAVSKNVDSGHCQRGLAGCPTLGLRAPPATRGRCEQKRENKTKRRGKDSEKPRESFVHNERKRKCLEGGRGYVGHDVACLKGRDWSWCVSCVARKMKFCIRWIDRQIKIKHLS
ncbi:hypothetical protein IscW_ISCW012946 [Ixodes scapularis]|uniref:Uncharacterized protein n=1 Tax=Ixodes scapularis TaxID=6945 RepID=B7QFT5_IXOSC|nr:hypothetical protein IscW_ISCW012946 [Ixodes scapularis]|eukprot:XP_002400896.1 hypothetical protein IscW_ISCW012946 [Ixodes scapularis]